MRPIRRTHWSGRLACGLGLCFLGALQLVRAEPEVTGDPARGAGIYSRCLACHALEYDRTGPRHCGLFGRKAGSVPGFEYSDAMKKSNIIWNSETLNWFLQSPMTAIPGTAMGYAGISDAQERADLIAYLKQADASPQCKGK